MRKPDTEDRVHDSDSDSSDRQRDQVLNSNARPVAAQNANAAAGQSVLRRLAGTGEARVDGADAVQRAASDGFRTAGGPLPHLDRIQKSFGKFDVSGVKAHQGEASEQANRALGAQAYASGDQVAFAGGSPSLHTAAHEAAHTVQQRAGVHFKDGLSEEGDEHERHADEVADAVVDGRSAEPILEKKVGEAQAQAQKKPGSDGATATAGGPSVAGGPVQRLATGPLSRAQAASAVRFNAGKKLPADAWAKVATIVGALGAAVNDELVQKIATWQKGKGLDADGCVGDISMQWLSQEPGGEALTEQIQKQKITFLGLNPDSKNVELSTLKRAAGADMVTGLTGTAKQDHAQVGNQLVDLNTAPGLERALAQLANLPPAKASALSQFIQDSGEGSKDEIFQLVSHLWNVERGKALMKRLVISGHSWGSSVWGDENGSIPFPHLERLCKLFPIAAGQVEDLMFSACNTGQVAKLDQYHRMFPNLKSIWGYAGYSPSAGTGSTRHITEWEKGSRSGKDDGAGVDKAREKVGQGSGPRDDNAAVWSESSGYKTESHYAEMSYYDIRSAVDRLVPVYDRAFTGGDIDKPQLDQLQTLLQNITGMHAASLGGELEKFKQMNARTLYLRHWGNITKHFVAAHRTPLEAGYRDAELTLPNFVGMSRVEVLAQIKTFVAAAKGAPAKAAAKLLTEILRDLDQAQIPDTWN